MQFCIDFDNGGAIGAWIVPNNPSRIPRLRITSGGFVLSEVDANVHRQDIKDLGLHGTGQVGFYIDDALIPGLSEIQEMEVFECESDVLIHRRQTISGIVEHKVMFFNLLMMPQIRMFRAAQRYFTLSYANAERFNFDTIHAVLNNHFSNSILVSGRNNNLRISGPLNAQGYMKFCLLRDPLTELSERIVFAKLLQRSPRKAVLQGLAFGWESMLNMVDSIDVTNEGQISEAFSSLNRTQLKAIENPFVKSLACDPTEEVETRHLSVALDILSTFNVVGLEERVGDFNACVTELLGVDLFGDVAPGVLPGTMELRDRLAACKAVTERLELDIVLFQEVSSAVEMAFNNSVWG